MFCTNCGKQIPDDTKYCPNCGAATFEKKENFDEKNPPVSTGIIRTDTATTVKSSKHPRYMIAIAVIVLLGIVVAVFAFNSFSKNSPAEDSVTLDGEYAVVTSDQTEEYTYMNFNLNGPGTLRVYDSSNPSDILDVNYKIRSLGTEDTFDLDMYTLTIYNDTVEETDFFTFYAIDEKSFGIQFADWLEIETDGIMVPFTEEYGFAANSVNANSAYNNESTDANALPVWCAGTYYGADLHSRIIFSDSKNSPFFISIYRLVDIENCIITSQDENQISFSGNFDIDVGSVKGTLTNYDGTNMTLTITESDWAELPEGTVMDFYYNYQDSNYTAYNSGENVSGMCGIYASCDIPANRLFVWENNGMLYIAIMNRDKTIATTEVSFYELDSANDCTFFTAYTIGSEDEFSVYYDPSVEMIEIWGTDNQSLLFSYGIEGFYEMQYFE